VHRLIETSTQEVPSVVGKGYVSYCFGVTHICHRAGLVAYDIEQLYMTFGVPRQNKMPVLGEEFSNLIALGVAADPRMC